ncbi:Fimbrial protein precursor [Vibrio thalassae]|uniref:Fimbrial protein n=1 Tax=Vibrio thalassae TaxID=1243014 RepID=A0A240ERB7_9VIBR|nr:pilin [Vibrio thalassae]SNX50720.1 Fimbrial protein precursor [Vibrio thalassae]
MNKKINQKGFTLIELMIVVAVIGVLAAVALPQYQKYVGKSEAASALATLSGLRTNIEAYTLEQGSFPDTKTTPDLKNRLGFPIAIIDAIEADAGVNGAGNIILSFDQVPNASPSISTYKLALARNAQGGWSCISTASEASGVLPKGCGYSESVSATVPE